MHFQQARMIAAEMARTTAAATDDVAAINTIASFDARASVGVVLVAIGVCDVDDMM